MMLRSPAITALAVLFIALGVVVVAVDSFGIDTAISPPDTGESSGDADAAPEGVAGSWVQVAADAYQYTGTGLETPAQINIIQQSPAAYAEANGLVLPEGADDPLISLLDQSYVQYQGLLNSMDLSVEPAEPTYETFGGVQLATLSVNVEPQPEPDGTMYPGLDIFIGMLQSGDDLVSIQYIYQGLPNAQLDADLHAWLEENVARIAEEAAANPSADTAAAAEAAPPEMRLTQATSGGNWIEVSQGVFAYNSDENIVININVQDLDMLAANIGYAPEDGDDVTVEGFLGYLEGYFRPLFESDAMVTLESFSEPFTVEAGDRTIQAVEYTFSMMSGEILTKQDIFLAVVPVENGDADDVALLQFRYEYEDGTKDDAVKAAFREWLDANADAITQLAEPAADSTDAAETDDVPDDTDAD